MNDLKNKNIIVTGASGGIGNSIVKKLYQVGANVLVAGSYVFGAADRADAISKVRGC